MNIPNSEKPNFSHDLWIPGPRLGAVTLGMARSGRHHQPSGLLKRLHVFYSIILTISPIWGMMRRDYRLKLKFPAILLVISDVRVGLEISNSY